MADDTTKMDPMILIKRVLDKAGIDGTLTDNAAEYFNDALKQNKEMKSKIIKLEGDVASRSERIKDVERENEQVLTQNNVWLARESELKTREEEMLKLELVAEYEAERVKDHKEMFKIVFKNLETRRNVFTPYTATPGDPPGSSTQYPSPSGIQQDEEVTKIE